MGELGILERGKDNGGKAGDREWGNGGRKIEKMGTGNSEGTLKKWERGTGG